MYKFFNKTKPKTKLKLKIRIFLLIFILNPIFIISYAQQNINGWYWLNGRPQSNTLNWVKIINSSTFYAAGGNGTFMKSTDGGDSWIINSQAGSIDSSSYSGGGTNVINSAWFFDANTGVVGGNSLAPNGDAIGRTTDGGRTFTRISLGSEYHNINKFYFINPTTGYACGNSVTKLVKTTDAGLTWTAVPNVPSISYYSVFAHDENNIFITTSGRRIFSTSNAGLSWTEYILPGSANIDITDIEFKDASTGYITGNENYFAYTTNGGINWNPAFSPAALGQHDLKIYQNNVYTAGDFTKIYKTSNNGIDWVSQSFVDIGNPYQPDPYVMLCMDISGDDIIVAGYDGIINISNDGGSSWRNKNYSVSSSSFHFKAIWADSPTGKIWTGGTPGSMLYSTNGGTNWTEQATNSTLPLNKIQMLNSSTGFAVTGVSNLGNLIKTTNGGSNWIQIPLPAPYSGRNALDLEFINPNTGWIAGGVSFQTGETMTCIKTTNGGLNWTQQQNDFNNNIVYVSIDMADENTGYIIAGATNYVFKTINGGNNWKRIFSFPGAGAAYEVTAVSSSVVFVSGEEGQLYKSTDGGISWTNIPVPIPTNLIGTMAWVDENNGWIGGNSGFTAKTTNSGLTWKTFNTGGSSIRDICMRNKDSIFAVSDINGSWQVFRYFDSTASKLSLNLTVAIEGFWNGTTQVSDTIRCNLRNSVAPYNLIDQGIAVLNDSGYATVTFPKAVSGNYYLQILHRNALETWSAAPVNISYNLNNYDFTTSSSKAFGDNMILFSGKYCIYEGDANQDGSVTLTDLLQVYNSSANYNKGYVSEDLNGSNNVDLTDIVLAFNNVLSFVTKETP